MKKVYVFLLPLAMLLCACCAPSANAPEPCGKANGPAAELAAIDSLMWRQPDSAFLLLRQFAASPMADSLDEYNTHYFHLLLAELLYKNDCAQTNRPNVLQAVDYFDSLTINSPCASCRHCGRVPQSPNLCCDFPFLDARAHYINGVGYYEKDSVVQACAEYLKALEIMEEHFEEKDLVGLKARFMTYTNNRLGDLFSRQYMMEPAIECYENSLAYCRIEPTSPHSVSNTLFRIGKQYDKKNETAKARTYYEQALEGMKNKDNLLYRDILSSKTLCDYQLGIELAEVMSGLRKIVANAETEEERLNRFLTIGAIFKAEKAYDSALFYFDPIFQNGTSLAFKTQAAENMRIIYDSMGNKEKSDECMRYLIEHKQSEGENKALVSELEELHQAYIIQKKTKETEVRQKAVIKRVLLVVVPIAVVLIMAIVFFAKLRSKNLLKKQQDKADKKLGETEQLHRIKQASMSGRLKKSNEALRDTLKKLEEKEAELKTIESNSTKRVETDNYEAFRQASVCSEILKTVDNLHSDNRKAPKTDMDVTEYKAFALSLSQKAQLSKTVETAFPRLRDSLEAMYPSLDQNEWLHCCLYLLQLDKMSICVLLQEPYYTCRRCTLKLEEAFNCRRGLTTFLVGQARGC